MPTPTSGTGPLVFRIPASCERASECDVYVEITANSSDTRYLDIYLEGVADGWVAVGFSKTASMVSHLLF